MTTERAAYEKWMDDNFLTEYPPINADVKPEESFAWRAWQARAALSVPSDIQPPTDDTQRYLNALWKIAFTADEDNEWDGRDKFRESREIALAALKNTPAASDSQRQSEGNGCTAGGSPAPEAGPISPPCVVGEPEAWLISTTTDRWLYDASEKRKADLKVRWLQDMGYSSIYLRPLFSSLPSHATLANEPAARTTEDK